jgi:hypothetical protein
MPIPVELHKAWMRLRQYGRFAIGRLTGSTTSTNGAYRQLMAMEEGRLIQRVELTALTRILLDKGIVTTPEVQAAFLEESRHLEAQLAKDFPEVKPLEDGTGFSLDAPLFAKRCAEEKWPR